MNPGIDDQAHATKQLCLQTTEIVVGIIFKTRFPGQALRIQCPAFGKRCKAHHFPELRHTGHFDLQGVLQMMARHRFVIGQRAHAIFRVFFEVAEVGVKHARSRSIHRWPLVVSTGRIGLAELGNPLNLDLGFWQRHEILGHFFRNLVNNFLEILEDLLATLIVIRIKKAFFLVEQRHPFRHAPFAVSFRRQNFIHLALDACDLGQPQLMNFVGSHIGRCV